MTEKRLALFGKAQTGRDIYRAIREQVNNVRAMGIEPKRIWVSQYAADCIHSMWALVAASYDLRLPPAVAGVPFSVGNGLGRNQFELEYHEDQSKAHTLKRRVANDPMPGN